MPLTGGIQDKALYLEASRGEDSLDINSVTTKKDVVWIPDQNNNSYSGQLSYDFTSLINTQKMTSLKEGYIVIPIGITVNLTTGTLNAAINSYILGLKNNFCNFINSVQIDVNGTNITSPQPYTNAYINSKIHFQWSSNTVNTIGANLGFYQDSYGSSKYSATAATDGLGYCNNITGSSSPSSTFNVLQPYNSGYVERMRRTTAYTPNTNGLPNTSTPLQCAAVGQNYFVGSPTSITSATGSGNVGAYQLLAMIRLRDISSFFENVPLTRCPQIRLYINYNLTTTILTITSSPTMTCTTTQQYGNTCPYMISDVSATGAGNCLVPGSGSNTYTISMSIGQNISVVTTLSPTASTVCPPLLYTSRIYIPTYTLTPEFENELTVIQSPVRTIWYEEIYNQNFLNTTSTTFNAIVNNGLPNLKYLIIIPTVSASANSTLGLTPLASPFSSVPGTLSSPNLSITNFQVFVANNPIFVTPISYTFQTFLDEIASLGLYGSTDDEISSGLLNQQSWSQDNQVLVCDLSRNLTSQLNVPQSVTVSLTNNNTTSTTNNITTSIDLYCWIVYGKKVKLDIRTGGIEI